MFAKGFARSSRVDSAAPIARVARASRRRKNSRVHFPHTGTKKILSIYNRKTWTMKLPDEISNEDYVVDSDEIMEDVTQEKNAENDKDQQW